MRPHDHVRRGRLLRLRGRVPGGQHVRERGTAPRSASSRDRRAAAGASPSARPVRVRHRRSARSSRSSAGRASRGRPSAAWSSPVGLRVPSGKTTRTLPASSTRWASRNASTSAAPRSTGTTPPLRRHPADDRPLEHLLLAEPVDPPPEPLREPGPDEHRVGVRDVVAREDHRPVARDRVEVALDPDPGDAACHRPGAAARTSRSAASGRRGRARPRRSRLGGRRARLAAVPSPAPSMVRRRSSRVAVRRGAALLGPRIAADDRVRPSARTCCRR